MSPDSGKDHLFAVVKWPQVHPQRYVMGKPIEVWCNDLFEPRIDNKFLPIENIRSRIITAQYSTHDTGENTLVTIPLVSN